MGLAQRRKKEEERRKKEEGRGKRVPHVLSILPLLILPDSPWRLILGSYALALLTIVQGMAALSHLLSLSLPLTRIRDLGSATMCDSNEQMRSKLHSL
jgi:hypothetical protein